MIKKYIYVGYVSLKKQLSTEMARRRELFNDDSYKPRKKTLQELVTMFSNASTYEEKEVILREIENVRGSIPVDFQLELKKLNSKTR